MIPFLTNLILHNLPNIKDLQLPNSLIHLHINACYELRQIIGLDLLLNPASIEITQCPHLSYMTLPLQYKFLNISNNSYLN